MRRPARSASACISCSHCGDGLHSIAHVQQALAGGTMPWLGKPHICQCANSLHCSWLLLGVWPAQHYIAQSFSLLPSIAVTALLQDGLLILSAKFGTKEAIAEAELAEQRHRRGSPGTSRSASADGGLQQPASPVQRRTHRPTWQPGKL